MNKKKHLTNAERTKIKTLLSQGFSIRSIVFAIFTKCCTCLGNLAITFHKETSQEVLP